MSGLYQTIPDADLLVALAPEQLGKVLLSLVRATRSKMFQTDTFGQPPQLDDWYPSQRVPEIEQALLEGWAWLTINMLILPAAGTNGANGWRVLSRRAMALETGEQFNAFTAASSFSRSLLHPKIADKVWLRLSQGELDDAVFAAFKEVEISVRAAGGFADTDIGVPIMRKAFHVDGGPLSDPDQPPAEREALSNLFAGAIGSYKNPHSHRTVRLTDPAEAQEMVLLASHLLRIVDARRSQFQTVGG